MGFIFPPIYISVKQEAVAGYFHVHSHHGVLKIVNMNGNKLQRYFIIRFSRGANNCAFEKTLLHNDISTHFKFLLSNERLDLCDFFK